MSDRISHRVPGSLLTTDEVLDERNWKGQTAEELKARLRAQTLREMVRLMGLKPPKRTIHACAAAIAQHAADVSMGRAPVSYRGL